MYVALVLMLRCSDPPPFIRSDHQSAMSKRKVHQTIIRPHITYKQNITHSSPLC